MSGAGVFIIKNDFPVIAAKLEAKSTEAEHHAAEAWANAAQNAAPVDTGTLRNSGHADGSDVVFDAVNTSGEPYAGFVEFGTHNTPAQPFLRPTEHAGRRVLEADLKVALE